jgi:hypothetical protein
MAGPFIFIASNRLKPGKLDAERHRVPGLVMLDVDGAGNSATWGDHVSDAEYGAAPSEGEV